LNALGPALHVIARRADRPAAISLGADKAYDAEDLGRELIRGGWTRCSSGNGVLLETKISAQNELVRSRPS
jgi:hypothetical protein